MINNQVVIITGGLGRLGKAFSRRIVSKGGLVILGDVINDKDKSFIRELGKENAVYYNGDLTKPELIDELIQIGLKKFGKIDSAVHCAYPVSKQWGRQFEDLQPEYLKTDLFNQLGGAILFSQRIIKYFYEVGYGNLVHISSIQGISAPKFEHYDGTDMVSPIEYSAIKSGIISMTRYLAKYVKGKNIRVNSLSPGGILSGQPDIFQKRYNSSCISKGMLDSADLTGALIFLLSKESKYITGQNIIVDDGWSL